MKTKLKNLFLTEKESFKMMKDLINNEEDEKFYQKKGVKKEVREEIIYYTILLFTSRINKRIEKFLKSYKFI